MIMIYWTDTVVCWIRYKHELHRIDVRSTANEFRKTNLTRSRTLASSIGLWPKNTHLHERFSVYSLKRFQIIFVDALVYQRRVYMCHCTYHHTLNYTRHRPVWGFAQFLRRKRGSWRFLELVSFIRLPPVFKGYLSAGRDEIFRTKFVEKGRFIRKDPIQRYEKWDWNMGFSTNRSCLYTCFIYFNDTLETRSGFVLIFFIIDR